MENKGRLRHHPIVVFLGSMNLAIALLVMLAIASVIGTVLKQNEAYASYVIKFGPFWFEVFRNLELYDVYSAIWFLSVLAFLLASISACVWRNGGHFIKDMFSFQEHQHAVQLQKSALTTQWHTTASISDVCVATQSSLSQAGFKLKTEHKNNNQQLIAGKKGSLHRLGYFFSHIAIIVICLGALLDSNLKFKFREWAGYIEPETRTLALKDVNPKANIDANNFAFRGSVNIPEGKRADVVFLTFKDGYLVQKLPFQIQVIDFRVEHYDTGMPKSFESDIMLIDDALDAPIYATLSVNKPLIYKDYAIYQSSFGDGGSHVSLNAWPLLAQQINQSSLKGEIHQPLTINTPLGDYKIELDDYKTNNVIPLPDNDPSGKKQKNLGPSIQFKIRDSAGQAVEYENYVTAIERNGHWYHVSKYRHSMSQPFEFLMIPLDNNMSLQTFMSFLARVNDRQSLNAALDAAINQEKDPSQRESLITQKKFMQQLVNLFRMRGFEGIEGYIAQAVTADKRDQMLKQYIEVLTIALQSIYITELEKNHTIQQEISEEQRRFFTDSIEAISQLYAYGPPMLFEVSTVEPRESSGLQITKSPGKNVVYLGSFLLIIGVFLLFYVRPQRIWCLIREAQDGHTEIILAAKDSKNDAMMEPLFTHIKQQLQTATPPAEEHLHA